MKLSSITFISAISSIASAAAIPEAQITAAPKLVKRSQNILSDAVWTSTSSKVIMAVTPTVIDGVTISASPVSSLTPWASLDSSGIPSMVTPTVTDGSTLSASPTPTDTSYPSPAAVPPVLRCFGDRVPDTSSETSPFCTAYNGTEMLVGETYWLTWDPTFWGGDDVTKVKIELIAYPQTGADSTLLTAEHLSNSAGYYPLTIESSFIRSGNGNFFLTITPYTTAGTDATNVGTQSGPLIRAISSKSDASTKITRVPSDNSNGDSASSSSSSSKSSNTKVIAPAVIVPVVAVLAIAAGVVWYLQKQRKANSPSSNTNNGEIQLSPSSTNHDASSIITTTTNETQNPFKETARTVL